MNAPNPVFTIGHSNHEPDRFFELLRASAVDTVADVRSQPYSRMWSQFNRESLQAFLRVRGVRYVFLGEELGARRVEPHAYDGPRARYDLVARCDTFQRGLARVAEGAKEWRIALMCAEKDPLTCHRTILIARHLRRLGIDVQHILDDGSLESAAAADRRLLDMVGLPEYDLFRTHDELVEHAYDVQGDRIAYSRAADAAGEAA